ncbi:DUF5687 family protein [Microbacter margulisiae]|uniref:ABC-2 type transport system permease protein n=1 Tax=Microbacter margulisiae TaxID=1350067 RepID=A0A7W5DT43_9PORP|nr:DUF5687 family protein [Microbacter margulisiae]MBB3188431.1 hypothetical protein [Microbacter margulisiae]
MLTPNLIKQEWIKSIRSQGFYRNALASFFIGIFVLYICGLLFFLGFSLNKILEKVPGEDTPMQLFNGAMIYLLLGGLTLRFLMQQLNTINLPSYQVLPLKRSTLINFLLLKPLASPANYALLLAVIPFAIRSVAGYYNGMVALRFVVAFELMVWFNSLLAAFLKRKFGGNLLSFFMVLGIIAIIVTLEYFRVFSLFALSKALFGFIVLSPVGLLLPLLAVAVAFMLNKWFFAQNYYPERFNRKLQTSKTATADLAFLNRFGIIGELISVEVKLMLRHKRTRSMLFLSIIFLFYGLLFYNNPHHAYGYGMLFFIAMFMTGILMYIYGQWSISWDSTHFDGLLTKNIPVPTYIKANYYLMLAFNVICFVLTTPYFLFGSTIVYMHLAAFLFNIGVNIYLLLFLATYNTKRVDLSRSSVMNYQGTTYKSFLIVLPIMFLPMLLVNVIAFFTSIGTALWTLAILGIIGLALRNPLINLCVKQFNNRKYVMAEGFREKE